MFEKVIFSILSLPSTWNWQDVSWLKCRCSVFCESLWRWNIRQHITVHVVVRSLNVSERWAAFLIRCHTSQQRVGGHEVPICVTFRRNWKYVGDSLTSYKTLIKCLSYSCACAFCANFGMQTCYTSSHKVNMVLFGKHMRVNSFILCTLACRL